MNIEWEKDNAVPEKITLKEARKRRQEREEELKRLASENTVVAKKRPKQ